MRYVDPNMGMGVEFIGVKLETEQKLHELLRARVVN